jgi:hypothetical protein
MTVITPDALAEEEVRELVDVVLRGGQEPKVCNAFLLLMDEVWENLSAGRDASDVVDLMKRFAFSYLDEPQRSYIAMLREQGIDGADGPPAAPRSLVPAAAATKPTRDGASLVGGVCGVCQQEKIKDGKSRNGRQRWRCPQPHNGQEVRGTRAARRGKSKKKSRRPIGNFADNPACPGGHGPMNITGRVKGVVYYACKKGCPPRERGAGWSTNNLPVPAPVASAANNGDASSVEPFIRRRVAALNHHNSQNRDDIVQEILLAVESKEISRQDLHDDNVLRRYIRSVEKQEPNRFRDVPLDAPPRDGETPMVEKLAI